MQRRLRHGIVLQRFASGELQQALIVEARRLAKMLLMQLFPETEPTLFIFEPDFFVDVDEDVDQAYYFEGKGCDNAILLMSGSIADLLLTNGSP